MPKSAQRWVTNLSSSTKLPSSSSAAMRSRAVSLPASCCLSMRALPPASAARASISSRRRIGSWELTAAAYRRGPCRSRDAGGRPVRDDPAIGAVVELERRAVELLEPFLEAYRDPADLGARAGELERDRAVGAERRDVERTADREHRWSRRRGQAQHRDRAGRRGRRAADLDQVVAAAQR